MVVSHFVKSPTTCLKVRTILPTCLVLAAGSRINTREIRDACPHTTLGDRRHIDDAIENGHVDRLLEMLARLKLDTGRWSRLDSRCAFTGHW